MADDDWRLHGQEDWLAGRPLRWSRWWSDRESWDHDHCEFCWAKISMRLHGQADAQEAYVTADDEYTWICAPCFTDLHDRFRWTVVEPR